MKKFIFFIVLLSSISYSYVTATFLNPQGENILIYNNKFFINYYKRIAKLPFLSSKIEKVKVEYKNIIRKNEFEENETIQIPQIKFKDIFNYIILNYPESQNDEIFIDDKLCKIETENSDIDNLVIGKKEGKSFIVNCDGDLVFEMKGINSNSMSLPVEFDIKGKKLELTRIINDDVKKYEQMKKTLKTVLDNFDFFKEPIWGTYVVHTEEGDEFLKAIFKMEDKTNKIFSVTLKSKFNILNPLQHSSMKAETIAYLLKRDSLYEIQNVWLLNSEPILKWVIQDGEVIMVYLDEKNQQQQIEMYLSKLPYDIAGVWYLVSYCSKNNINSYKFSFMANNTRFEGIMNKSSNNSYEIKAYSGDVLIYHYKFFVDRYNRIKEVKDLKNDYDIRLKEFLNKTIEQNRKTLKEFFYKHHLKVIDEEN